MLNLNYKGEFQNCLENHLMKTFRKDNSKTGFKFMKNSHRMTSKLLRKHFLQTSAKDNVKIPVKSKKNHNKNDDCCEFAFNAFENSTQNRYCKFE